MPTSDKKSAKKSDKKSTSKDKKSDKKDRDKSVKSDKKSTKSDKKSSKSASPSKKGDKDKDKKKSKKDDDAKSSKSKKEDLNASKSQIDADAHGSQNEPDMVGSGAVEMKPAGEAGLMNLLGAGSGILDRKRMCMIHKQPLRYFCVSCEELICYDCTVMGPHNTQLHRISSIEDAFRDRFDGINKHIHQSLVPKRAQLIGQIVRLDHRLDEIKAVKGVIDKDIRDEYAAIMARLKSAEGVKLAVLQYDIAEIQKDITRIDEILMSMEEIVSGDPSEQTAVQQPLGPDQLQFLHKFRQLNENIEYAVTKHFKVEIEVLPNDLPRELAERRVLMEHYEEQRKLLKFKDEVIHKLSQELKKKYDYFQDEFDKETRNEMNEWARLVDRYGGELKKFDLVCAFCGQHLSDGSVNTDCVENNQNVLRGRASASQNSINMGSDGVHLSMYYTEEEPPMDFIGKRRHYFGKPSIRGVTSGNQVIRGEPSEIPQNVSGGISMVPSSQVILRNPESSEALRGLVGSQTDLRGRFESTFRALDAGQQGIIRKDDFVNTLFEVAKDILAPSQILAIVQQLTTTLDDAVNYQEFLKLLDRSRTINLSEDQSLETGSHLVGAMREQIHGKIMNLSHQDREVVDRLRAIIKQTQGDLGRTFSRFASRGSDKLSLDELLIAMSRVSDNVHLGDIKDLFRILLGVAPGSMQEYEESKVPINEIVQMLTL